ncbi:MAG: hypothetical protein AB8B97_05585 [Granulosicoccus sp.]
MPAPLTQALKFTLVGVEGRRAAIVAAQKAQDYAVVLRFLRSDPKVYRIQLEAL